MCAEDLRLREKMWHQVPVDKACSGGENTQLTQVLHYNTE